MFLPPQPPPRPLLVAHYMPWFQTKTYSGSWGFHWSMNQVDNEKTGPDGKPQIASKYTPLTGPYDSADPAVLEYQFLLMKVAGIDGVLIDWYGISKAADYPGLQINTQKAIDAAKRVGLKIALVYEDHTLVEISKTNPGVPPTKIAADTLAWADKHWFHSPSYIQSNGKPLFLVFGPSVLKNDDWKTVFASPNSAPAFYTLRNKLPVAEGAFAWPFPQLGLAGSWTNLEEFYKTSTPKIAVAYPRFDDDYANHLGLIPDDDGKTFHKTMEKALESHPDIIQLTTWNDWGEGTQIEPSEQLGYRDLAYVQETRHKLDPTFRYQPGDLELPLKLFQLRTKSTAPKARLDAAAEDINTGHTQQAARLLSRK